MKHSVYQSLEEDKKQSESLDVSLLMLAFFIASCARTISFGSSRVELNCLNARFILQRT
jgi:hypothetical protein